VEQYQQLSSLIPFDPEAQNEKKKTAIQIAMQKGNIAFVQVLFSIKPEVSVYNSDIFLLVLVTLF
jgi:ankyrin repeat protein